MPRTILEEARLHPEIRDKVTNLNADIVHNVQAAASSNPVRLGGVSASTRPTRSRHQPLSSS